MTMILGVDVHKHTHTAALLDPPSGEISTLTFANSADGVTRLRDWLAERGGAEAVVGIENAAGYGRLLAAALIAAGHEVLTVPSWRTHRDRDLVGPGKSDAGDAAAIAEVVLRKRSELGPAAEPEVVRAMALLESLRRQSVVQRTQAIQRLRAIWTQVDPEGEREVAHLHRQRPLRKLRRISFGSGLAERTAARCIRELAREVSTLNDRIGELETEMAGLLEKHGNPLADLQGAGPQVAAAVVAHAGDVRRFRSQAAFARFCGVAPIPCGSGQSDGRHRLHRGGNRQLNAALHRIAIVQARVSPEARAFLARKRDEGKTARKARRALKRHLANVVFRRLLAWAPDALEPASI
jgi:transposase